MRSIRKCKPVFILCSVRSHKIKFDGEDYWADLVDIFPRNIWRKNMYTRTALSRLFSYVRYFIIFALLFFLFTSYFVASQFQICASKVMAERLATLLVWTILFISLVRAMTRHANS